MKASSSSLTLFEIIPVKAPFNSRMVIKPSPEESNLRKI